MPKPGKRHPRRINKAPRASSSRCVFCRKIIERKPRVMMLQITSGEPRFVEEAKKLGFTSDSWDPGDYMRGTFHTDCFNRATLMWKIAFRTRAVSPRR